MNPKLKAVLESVLIATISTVLLIILAFLPVLNIIIFVWPVPFIVIGVRRGLWAGVLSLVLAGLLLGIVIHPLLGIGMVILNIFLVLGLSWAITRKLDLLKILYCRPERCYFPLYRLLRYFPGRRERPCLIM